MVSIYRNRDIAIGDFQNILQKLLHCICSINKNNVFHFADDFNIDLLCNRKEPWNMVDIKRVVWSKCLLLWTYENYKNLWNCNRQYCDNISLICGNFPIAWDLSSSRSFYRMPFRTPNKSEIGFNKSISNIYLGKHKALSKETESWIWKFRIWGVKTLIRFPNPSSCLLRSVYL